MFRKIATFLFIIGIGIAGYFRRKAEMRRDKVSIREESTSVMVPLRVAGLSMWLSVIIYLINPKWMAWSELRLPNWLRWIGVVTGSLAVMLTYWLFASIGTNITQTVGIRAEHQLVTHGLYRWIRHPLYSVGMLFFLSFALMAANWFMIIAVCVVFIFLVMRLPQEEERLIESFGDDYRDYMARTGRFLPKLNLND